MMKTEDLTKAVTVFDVDDLFWPLNEHVAEIAGVDYNDIVTFYARENPLLGPDARERLYQAYQTPGLHADMDFYPGAEAFGELSRDPRIDPWICSNSLDGVVVGDKLRNLEAFLAGDWKNFRTMMNVIAMEHSKKKKFPDDVWLLFDDSPLNAVASGAEHVLMPRRPWNVSGWGASVIAPIRERVLFYGDPREGAAMARELLDRNFGPPHR